MVEGPIFLLDVLVPGDDEIVDGPFLVLVLDALHGDMQAFAFEVSPVFKAVAAIDFRGPDADARHKLMMGSRIGFVIDDGDAKIGRDPFDVKAVRILGGHLEIDVDGIVERQGDIQGRRIGHAQMDLVGIDVRDVIVAKHLGVGVDVAAIRGGGKLKGEGRLAIVAEFEEDAIVAIGAHGSEDLGEAPLLVEEEADRSDVRRGDERIAIEFKGAAHDILDAVVLHVIDPIKELDVLRGQRLEEVGNRKIGVIGGEVGAAVTV